MLIINLQCKFKIIQFWGVTDKNNPKKSLYHKKHTSMNMMIIIKIKDKIFINPVGVWFKLDRLTEVTMAVNAVGSTEQVSRPLQSLKYPFSPQFCPQEFFIIQWPSDLYPTTTTSWSTVDQQVVGHKTPPVYVSMYSKFIPTARQIMQIIYIHKILMKENTM